MEPTPKTEEVIDPELARARKSMGNRIDPDPVPEVPEEPTTPPAKVEEPATPTAPETPPVVEVEPPAQTPAKVERPEAYIPMPKYLNEKKDWESKASTAEERAKIAEAKVAELTNIASQNEGAQKDEDIEAFMEKTGFDRETVEGFLELATKRLAKGETLSPEEKASVARAAEIVKEAELVTAFNTEFSTIGEPEIKKAHPNATPEQLAKAKELLDKVAHTSENRTQPLDFLIYKNREEIAKIMTGEPEPVPPVTKKTIEPNRIGNGHQTTLTASDFAGGKTDFGVLGDLDPAVRSEIIKNFDTATYNSFISYAKAKEGGVVVMRNGSKVTLK